MSELSRHIPVRHEHVQAVESTEWTIIHNMGRLPVIDVYVSSGGETKIIYPALVEVIDEMSCVISFSIPRSGTAILS
jgi:hypothetical protein